MRQGAAVNNKGQKYLARDLTAAQIYVAKESDTAFLIVYRNVMFFKEEAYRVENFCKNSSMDGI